MVGPAAKRAAVAHLQDTMGLSERRACSIAGADRTMVRYRSCRPPDTALRARLRELANERRRFGYRRLFVLLRREGEPSGINRIHRLYREEGLAVRKRRARRKAMGVRVPILLEAKPNVRWSLDFVYDQFANGRRFRVLNIVDDVTKECLGAIPDTSISGRRVARELTAIVERRGKPGSIVSDNKRDRVHLQCHAGLVQGLQNRLALHRPGQADPERLRQEFGKLRAVLVKGASRHGSGQLERPFRQFVEREHPRGLDHLSLDLEGSRLLSRVALQFLQNLGVVHGERETIGKHPDPEPGLHQAARERHRAVVGIDADFEARIPGRFFEKDLRSEVQHPHPHFHMEALGRVQAQVNSAKMAELQRSTPKNRSDAGAPLRRALNQGLV
jgi:transposase InsO family protein